MTINFEVFFSVYSVASVVLVLQFFLFVYLVCFVVAALTNYGSRFSIYGTLYQKYIRVALTLLTSFPKTIIIGSDFSTPT